MLNNDYNFQENSKSIIKLISLVTFIVFIDTFNSNRFFENYLKLNIISFRIVLIAVLIASFLLLVLIAFFEYGFYRGIRVGTKTFRIKNQLKKQISESGHALVVGAKQRLPRIKVKIGKEINAGSLEIENSIRLNKKLETLNISSALNDYVVESYYLSDDENKYIYNIVNQDRFKKFIVSDFAEFHEMSYSLPAYKLAISKHDVLDLHHTLITGQTGSGKSYFIYQLILQMLTKSVKYNIFLVDPKFSGLAMIGDILNLEEGRNASKYEEIIITLRKFHAEMMKRSIDMNKMLSEKIDADYRDFNMEPYVLVFDEFAAFMGVLNTKPKAERDEIKRYINDIVLMGRQLGFFVIIAMQKSESEIINTSWRENLPNKIILGNNDSTAYTTTFGAGMQVPNRNYNQGEGVFLAPGITVIPKVFVAPTIGFDIYEQFTRLKNHRVGRCNLPHPEKIEGKKGG